MSTSLGGYQGFKGPAGKGAGKAAGGPEGYQQGTLNNFTPEQMQLFQSLFSQVGPNSYLSKLASGDQSTFEQLEAPAHRQFQGLQGDLASRFSGMGLGGRRSSGFANTANQATQDFASQLQSQRMGLQRQATQDLFGMSNQLLGQRPYENYLLPNQLSYGQQLGLAGVEGLGHIAGSWLGNR